MKDSFLMGYLYPKYKFYNPDLIILSALFIFLLITLSNKSGFAQNKVEQGQSTRKTITVTGIVISAIDGKPLKHAIVKTGNSVNGILTDNNGNFTLITNRINGGVLVVVLDGYERKVFQFSSNPRNLKLVLDPIKDPFRDRYPRFKALQIGEKVPDIEFAIKNYHSPTAKISDFKGKLLIFDFWTTYCAPCIASFPKMEKLQKQYGDKIQIILVNVRESEEKIVSKMKNISLPHEQLYSMPSIISNKALDQLFPHEFAGNYVWIDKEGILRMSSGISYNNNVDKINNILDGKEITFLKEGKTYNKNENSLSWLTLDSVKRYSEMGSTFTTVHKEFVPMGGQVLGDIDSNSKTTRTTIVNRSILELFEYTFDESIKETWKTRIYGPNFGTNSYLDYFSLLVKDSILYDNRFIPSAKETDINMVQSQFCYEQILPLNTTEELVKQFMQADLKRYFGLKYGTKANIEEVYIDGYLIKRINNIPVKEKEIKNKLKHLGKREYRHIASFESIIDSYYRPTNQDTFGPWIPYVFDVEGEDKKRDILMPDWRAGDKLEDFILALNANGLEFIKGEQKVKKMVIRDSQ